MTTPNIDTKALRQRKQQPIERIRDAFARAHKIATGGRAHYMSIPADAERDADLILSDAIDELEALRNAAPALLDTIDALRVKVTELGDTCKGWHRIGSKVMAERVALKAEVERLCKVDHWQSVAAGIRSERDALRAKLSASEREAERLREALKAAATSLQTIGRDAGRDEYMDSLTETRVYAASRSRVAFSALRGEEAPRE